MMLSFVFFLYKCFFQRRRIDPRRLHWVPRRPRQEYLGMYRHIDIGLDPVPYNGHTTSIDSFWMGVPVISLAGHTSVARGGASLLGNLGLDRLLARTAEQVVPTG